MNHFDVALAIKAAIVSRKSLLCAGLIAVAVGVGGCGDKEKKAGQALASVNGEEITVLQLNEELQRSGVQAAQQEAASKQLLDALIDRQLLQNEAVKVKLDRDPKVVQAIERAKAFIIAQAYMQQRLGNIAKPTEAEVEAYFKQHPEFFEHRKQFEMKELIVDTKDLDNTAKAAVNAVKTLDEVAAWFDAHKIKYVRSQLLRASSDLEQELSSKLQALPKGELFMINEGSRSVLVSIVEIKDAPVTLAIAASKIEQFLMNKKNKDASDAELKRLRALAKIEYLNKAAPAGKATAATPPTPTPAAAEVAPARARIAEPAAASTAVDAANERGVAGMK